MSRVELSDDEIPELLRRLTAILDHVQQLESVDTTGVPCMNHAAEAGSALREDAVRPSLDAASALSNGPDVDGTHFRVPRTVK